MHAEVTTQDEIDEVMEERMRATSQGYNGDVTIPLSREERKAVREKTDDVPDVIATPPDWKDSNPKDNAATSRLDLSLFPATARAYGALAMVEGHLKYGGYNYRAVGVRASVYYAAASRHLDKWFNGEEDNPKTGVPHLASALACIGIIIDAAVCGKLFDDRPPVADVVGVLDQFEEDVERLQSMYPDGPGRFTEKIDASTR
jgi:hypothetical protein